VKKWKYHIIPISETALEVDELPVDVDMVRPASLLFNEVEE